MRMMDMSKCHCHGLFIAKLYNHGKGAYQLPLINYNIFLKKCLFFIWFIKCNYYSSLSNTFPSCTELFMIYSDLKAPIEEEFWTFSDLDANE
jgi:hypothetical protein